MKKRPRAPARKTTKPRQDRAKPKAAASKTSVSKTSASKTSVSKTSVSKTSSSGRAQATIRRLRAELAKALVLVEELQASADMDFLLGILNRRGFERELNRSIAYIRRYHARAALIVLDVDRLKPINDTFGHAAGDQVLKAIAAAITAQVRASDVVGRLGGDEFAVLLWNLSETDARAKAAALEADIDRLNFVFDGCAVIAGASAGVAIIGADAEAASTLDEADSAMYVRKAQRRHERNATANPRDG